MSNPFQVQTPSVPKTSSVAVSRPVFWYALPAIMILLALLLWSGRHLSWLPEPLKNILNFSALDNRVFVANADLSREQARALYLRSLQVLRNGDYQEALDGFKRLESVYPGLQDFLWLHEAESYVGQGNEWAVQKKLTDLLGLQSGTVLKPVALYRLGQSQFRGSEWAKAQETFEKIYQKYPKTAYATGSLYYLGAVRFRQNKPRQLSIEPLKAYLEKCGDCKFSGDSADLLEKLLPAPSAEEHGLIGIGAAAASRDTKKTLFHLTQGARYLTWFDLARLQIRGGQPSVGVQTLTNGLVYAKDIDTFRAAIDLILATTAVNGTASVDKKNNILQALANRRFQLGGDYILWKQAELDEKKAGTHYKTLLRDYPQSDYAPESFWRQLWPLLVAGNLSGYLSGAEQYLQKYPYARSAPKAIFWIAKLQEKSSPAEATRSYKRITQDYPYSYYAFRAQGRLQVLAGGQTDPKWLTVKDRTDYPTENINLAELDILPPSEAFADGDTGYVLRDRARELQAIGVAEDMKLLVSEAVGITPPSVESWISQISGDRSRGLRIIRDALDEQAKASFLKGENGSLGSYTPEVSNDELKLLYPVYYSKDIQKAASATRLDPFLIQSLMREESYFNEFALSGSDARGLMQLLPATATDVAGWENIPAFKASALFLPEVNIRLGSRYLCYLHTLFNGNSMPAVGAYNGGPNAMKRWVNGSAYFANDPDMFVELIPYEQSRDYIKKVFASYWNYSRIYGHSSI